jgi:hypothetical protein
MMSMTLAAYLYVRGATCEDISSRSNRANNSIKIVRLDDSKLRYQKEITELF